MFADIKGGNHNNKLKKDRPYNGQKKKNKEWSTKHYTEK
jgi:hypothetical protein